MVNFDLLQRLASEERKEFEARLETSDEDALLFSHLSKVNEDIGNLASSVMGGSPQASSEAVADALYSLFILAGKLDVDVRQALIEKARRVEEEREQQTAENLFG